MTDPHLRAPRLNVFTALTEPVVEQAGRHAQLGGGRSGLDLTPIARCEEALRPPTRAHLLGNEVLFDCDLADQRAPIGAAKMSR